MQKAKKKNKTKFIKKTELQSMQTNFQKKK